ETYRECLRDVFDMPALIATLSDVRSRKVRIATVDSETPSPFAASLLFTYVASFIYDGDAPLAERRAQALSVDQSQLRELLGDAELRELLDAESIEAVERQLQRLDPQYLDKSADGLHDLLLSLGDLTRGEIVERSISADVAASRAQLVAARRARADPGGGEAALRGAIERLQGSPLPASILETEILPARIDVYDPADLDAVTAAGEVIWVGVEALGERDGRIALYLADHLPRLLAPDMTKARLKP